MTRLVVVMTTLCGLQAFAEERAPKLPPPLPVGAIERFVSEPIFQGKMRIVEAGRDKPDTVVLVHGLGDAGACDWYGVIPILAEHFHVVAFDLPGFARSDHLDRAYSPLLYATLIKWLADSEIRQPFLLVGHSMGGAIALRFATMWPHDLRRLVLVDAAGILFRTALVKLLLEKGSDDVSLAKRLEVRVFEAMSRNIPVDLELIWGARVVRRLLLNGESGRVAALALMDEDFSGLLSNVQVPTQLLWGEKDTIAPTRTARTLVAMLPDARLQLIPGAGHEPMHDSPDVFARSLVAALTEPLPSAFTYSPPSLSDRVGTCKGEAGKTFTGAYRRIELKWCSGVRIVDASVGSIVADRSDFIVERTRVEGEATGISLRESEMTGTAVLIRGDTAMDLDDARIDLAGASIAGANAAIVIHDKSQAIFSDCWVHSPYTSRGLQGAWTLTSDDQY